VDLILKVLGFVAAGIASVFISAAGNQTANEFRAWSPRVVDYLIKRAISRLPEHMRDRLYEEWHRVIQDTPGQVGQIVQALDYLRGAVRIARDAPPCRRSDRQPCRWFWNGLDEGRVSLLQMSTTHPASR